ncbi:hypothetical protein ACF0H5_007774 [Mactra antiquata]
MKTIIKILAATLLISSTILIIATIRNDYPRKVNNVQHNVETIKGYLLPSDDIIDGMSTDEILIAYWRYVNTLQILCFEQKRFGSLGDGGKNVCIDKELIPNKTDCLVYSFGSGFRFDFEIAIYHDFKCDIHTFDPSKPLTPDIRIPEGVTFHEVGLYGEDAINRRHWNMDTYPSIQKSLGHENRTIDIVKMDIEGSEWDAVEHMLKTGRFYYIKQLCIEWHLGKGSQDYRGRVTKYWTRYLKVLRKLYDAGFLMFMHEPGLHHKVRFKQPYPEYTSLIEISYINTRFYKV